jgi:hypothetical protein
LNDSTAHSCCQLCSDNHIFSPAWLCDSFYLRFSRATCSKLAQGDTQNLANTVTGLATLGLPMSTYEPDFLKVWSREVQRHADKMKGQEVASVFWALGALSLHVSDLAPDFVSTCLKRCRLSNEPHQLCLTVHGLAGIRGYVVGSVDVGFFRKWAACAMSALDQFAPLDHAHSLPSLGQLGVGPQMIGIEFFRKWAEVCSFSPEFTGECGTLLFKIRYFCIIRQSKST